MLLIYGFFYRLGVDLYVPLPNVAADGDAVQRIINVVLAVGGAIAFLIIVLAGFRLVYSQGNPNEVNIARNAIVYALIGLVVIMFAFAIVNFVVGEIG